jgi:hypothetical protein
MDMIKTNEATQDDNSLATEQSHVIELSDLQLVLIGGGIGDTQL